MKTISRPSSDSETISNDSDAGLVTEGESEHVLPYRQFLSISDGIEAFIDRNGTFIDEAEPFDDTTSSFSVEKMVDILRNGSESQQTVILFEIQQLLQHCFDETVEKFLPVLCECVSSRSEELQLSASEVFADIVQQPLSSEVIKMITGMCFQIIQSTCTEDSFEAWGEILVVILPDIKWESDNEIRRILQVVDEFSKAETECSRKLAARVLGSLSASIKNEEIEQAVMIRAMDMVHDEDAEVRGMVAESFSFIGADLDLRLTEKTLWPKLLALLHDPDTRIHAACLRSIAHILEAKKGEGRDSAVFRKLLPPVFARECAFARRAASEDQRTVDDDSYLLLEIIAEVFGPFLHALHSSLSEDIRKEAFKSFVAMSTCNGPIVRRYCAFNFPGVALSLQSTFKNELSMISECLSRDPDSETRWNLAAGIHKTCSILMEKHSMTNLNKAAMALLQDENPLVRMNALENFHELVRALHATNEAEKWSSSSRTPFFKGLAKISEGNWRTQELLAKQLKRIAEWVPYHCLRDNILPLLYRMAEEGTHCVRKETMMAIAKSIWCIPLPIEREEAFQKFFQEWGQGGVYWMRIAFIDCAQEALKIFSNDLYSYLFLPVIYQLARDNVPNVRLRVARMLHELAPFNHHEEEFRETVSWFREDSDPEVRAMMVDMEMKIQRMLKNIKSYRKYNDAREEAESELEEKAVLERLDNRKKNNKTKMKASAILPKIATKTAHLSPRHGRKSPSSVSPLLSPLSGSSDRSQRKSPVRLSAILSRANSKNKGSGKSSFSNNEGSVAESSPRLSSRRSLKHIFSAASPIRNRADQNVFTTRKTKLDQRTDKG